MRNVITHPHTNFRDASAEPPLKLGHGFATTSRILTRMYLLIHDLNAWMVKKLLIHCQTSMVATFEVWQWISNFTHHVLTSIFSIQLMTPMMARNMALEFLAIQMSCETLCVNIQASWSSYQYNFGLLILVLFLLLFWALSRPRDEDFFCCLWFLEVLIVVEHFRHTMPESFHGRNSQSL